MHLYTFSVAPNPQRIALCLKMKGIDIPTTEVDIRAGEHLNDEFKTINPASTLPALQLDNGTVLTDSVAICVYLESQFPDKPLFGTNTVEYSQVIGWIHKLYTEGLMPIAEILRNQGDFFKNRAMPGKINMPQIPALIERGKLRLDGFWQEMEEHLTEHKFIVGDQLTQADLDCFVICGFAGWAKESIPQECTALLAWYNTVVSIIE